MRRHRMTKRGRQPLFFESLEFRQLMAVTTSLAGGTLTITGDAAADDVAIVGTPSGEITVTGRNGTLVNGVADGSTTTPGVTGHLNANFGAGDNVINLDDIYLAGHLDLVTGSGNDRVILGATGVVTTGGDYFSVRSGEGSDVIRAEDYKVFIGGRLELYPEGGDYDSVTLIGASARWGINVRDLSETGLNEILLQGVTSGANVIIISHAPVNSIAMLSSAASYYITLETNSGHNSIYFDTVYSTTWISVTTYSRTAPPFPAPIAAPYNIDSTVTIARSIAPQIGVWTGGIYAKYLGGNDRIDLYGNLVVGPAGIYDHPSYPGLESNVIYVDTGDGSDVVSGSYNIARGGFFASLAEGNDTLSLAGNSILGFASADGGAGGNRLSLFGNQFGGFAAIRFA